MRMFNPPHPGEILAELWLDPLNLTITQNPKTPKPHNLNIKFFKLKINKK